eukprot:4740663-Prymnesium_polylepis.1
MTPVAVSHPPLPRVLECTRECTCGVRCLQPSSPVRGGKNATREADGRDRVARPLRGGWPFQLAT